jgi:predicted GNAT family N-acyltransferase
MVTNKWINGDEDFSEALKIRETVFIKEQNCPVSIERDGDDKSSIHLVLYGNNKAVGCGRITFKKGYYKIGRIAVLKPMRGNHYGDLIVRLLLFKSFKMGADEVRLNAQTQALEFYKRFGFNPIGKIFMEAGIEHISMKVTSENVVYPSDCSS